MDAMLLGIAAPHPLPSTLRRIQRWDDEQPKTEPANTRLLSPKERTEAAAENRRRMVEWLRANGPATKLVMSAEVGMSITQADTALIKLREDGLVRWARDGGNGVLWWATS